MIELAPLYNATYSLAPPRIMEGTPTGTLVLFQVTSGRVEGERLRGSVRELSGDWVTIRPDGRVGALDVRVTIETDDGAAILVTYCGRTIIEGRPGAAPLYIAPLFTTGDERYSFLNEVQAVGKGLLSEDLSRLEYEVYELR